MFAIWCSALLPLITLGYHPQFLFVYYLSVTTVVSLLSEWPISLLLWCLGEVGCRVFQIEQFIHHLSWSITGFPFARSLPSMQWKFSTLISEWNVSLGVILHASNSVPLKGWLEVLFDLSWRYPPGQDKDNILGSPHWACPVILSPEGKVQLDLSVLATILDNVIIYGTKKKYEQLWYGHRCMFWLIACANSSYLLLTWSSLIQESGMCFGCEPSL